MGKAFLLLLVAFPDTNNRASALPCTFAAGHVCSMHHSSELTASAENTGITQMRHAKHRLGINLINVNISNRADHTVLLPVSRKCLISIVRGELAISEIRTE